MLTPTNQSVSLVILLIAINLIINFLGVKFRQDFCGVINGSENCNKSSFFILWMKNQVLKIKFYKKAKKISSRRADYTFLNESKSNLKFIYAVKFIECCTV